jgi:hypothetical protein
MQLVMIGPCTALGGDMYACGYITQSTYAELFLCRVLASFLASGDTWKEEVIFNCRHMYWFHGYTKACDYEDASMYL